jgi:hypothetical protein
LESEAFLTGQWKNFDELESNLSLDELNAVVNAIRKKDYEDKKFFAAIQGIDIDEQSRGSEDVSDLQNSRLALQEGFGIGEGLGFLEL